MSRYEWERGTIVIPKKVWPTFRKTMIKAWNDRQDWLFEHAKACLARLKAMGKGKRNFDYHEAWEYKMEDDIHYREKWKIGDMIFKDGKLRSPQKKMLEKFPISKGASLSLGDGSFINLDDERHAATWVVSENNHACETARETHIAGIFFRELGKITWTRKTGGQIVGNDEYNRDSDYEGGGGNYTTAEYGPHVKKVAEPRAFPIRSPMMSPFFGRPW
jgi:hypothetical protein